MSAPSLRLERLLLREGHHLLAGVDEVGRGALAGPVSVGVVVVDAAIPTAPRGLRDSKLMTAIQRQQILPALRRWPRAFAVGHAQPWEIDTIGIIAALRLAAARAFCELSVRPTIALLDGNHDWLAAPQPTLFPDPLHLPGRAGATGEAIASRESLGWLPERVVTRIKADLTCASVAAASVLAKCERDAIMVGLHGRHPEYCWADNKGYAAPEHLNALRQLGPCELHRRSWRLPLPTDPATAADLELNRT